MFDIKFQYRDEYWLIHLPKLPKIGEQISVVSDTHQPLGRFWVAGIRSHNGFFLSDLTKLDNPADGMSVVAQLTRAPESP